MNIEVIEETFKVERVNNFCEIINIKDNEEKEEARKGRILCEKVYFSLKENYLKFETEKDLKKIKEIFQDSFYRLICDGCLIHPTNYLMILVELKTTFNRGKFKKALNQMIATYLKVISLLSLVYKEFFEFKPIFIFGFKDKEEIGEDEMKLWDLKFVEDSKGSKPADSLYFQIQHELKRSQLPICVKIPYIPLKEREKVNQCLHKQNVKLLVIKCGENHSLEKLINIC